MNYNFAPSKFHYQLFTFNLFKMGHWNNGVWHLDSRLSRYLPQTWLNFRRKSVKGFSTHGIIIKLFGASFLLVNSYLNGGTHTTRNANSAQHEQRATNTTRDAKQHAAQNNALRTRACRKHATLDTLHMLRDANGYACMTHSHQPTLYSHEPRTTACTHNSRTTDTQPPRTTHAHTALARQTTQPWYICDTCNIWHISHTTYVNFFN